MVATSEDLLSKLMVKLKVKVMTLGHQWSVLIQFVKRPSLHGKAVVSV